MKIIELRNLKDEAIKVDFLENLYRIFLRYKGLSIEDIQHDLMQKLSPLLVNEDESLKQSIAWQLTTIIAGTSSANLDNRLAYVARLISSQKERISNSLSTLLLAMAQSDIPEEAELAEHFISKLSKEPLYNQLLELDVTVPNQVPDGEDLPGRSGR